MSQASGSWPQCSHRHYVVAKSERPGRRYPKWNSHKKMASTQQSSDSNYQLSLYQSESISQCWLCSSATETKRNFHENWKTPTNTTNTQKKTLGGSSFFPGRSIYWELFFFQSLRQPVNHQRPDVNPWVPFPHRLPGRPHPGRRSNGAGVGMNPNTLPETNSSHPKMDGWKMKFPFGMAYFQGQTVSFREGNQQIT